MTGLADFVEDQLDGLDGQVSALTGNWNGAAAQAFDDAYAQWVTAAREFVASIRAASDTVRQAHDRFIAAAELNRRMT